MIIYKQWIVDHKTWRQYVFCDGWFLFGKVPLYIRKIIKDK